MSSPAIQILIVILSSLSTISATDIFLPSLPCMATYFEVNEKSIQMAIPIYLLGSFIAAPILGIFSDYFGRKPVMLSGMLLFLFGTAVCIYSHSLSCLLGGRFIQGFGAIVSPVVGLALIQDLYPENKSAKILSWMGSVIWIVPLIAPGIGGYIHILLGWQYNFILIFFCAAITTFLILFSKTKVNILLKKEDLSLIKMLKIKKEILTDVSFLFYTSFLLLLICGEWFYLTFSPFYFENSLNIPPNIFGFYLSCSTSFYILGSLFTLMILGWLDLCKTLGIGIILSFFGSIIFLFISLVYPHSSILIVISAGIYFFGISMVWAPAISKALQRFENTRGAASALINLFITFFSALGGALASFLDGSSLIPLAFFLLAMTIGCGLIFLTRKEAMTVECT